MLSIMGVEVEVPDPTLPEYTAVILSAPAGRVPVVNVAVPELLTTLLPTSVVPPLKKLTVPVGVPVGAGVILAVKVTGCPETAGLGETLSVVDVGASVTVSISALEVEGKMPGLPE
jgi:hypothetical protein